MLSHQSRGRSTAKSKSTESVAVRMADAMVVMAANGQTVTADELRLRGFTSGEIEKHGVDAADLATSLQRPA